MDDVVHPAFGQLRFDVYWTGKTSVKLFGQTHVLELGISGEEMEPFEDTQVNAFLEFVQSADDVLPQVEAALLRYYLSVRDDYLQRLLPGANGCNLPLVSAVVELSCLLKPTQLVIPWQPGEGSRVVGLLFDSAWEPEHGVGVRLVNEAVEDVGFQDVVL